ncbi:hypothetical protein [Pontiella agarivorans]|uniref:Outer membrane protein beta-barrel domain-containing protein n=1 Tax=Pontiella agarivorans TaxID=3038953 RepID=A0ABU5MYI2_9BACT|nr:hypothetical protein [Pontiella agarivorans]MDZ8119257.1 hypothetical protein [Pontiella agarivorans]
MKKTAALLFLVTFTGILHSMAAPKGWGIGAGTFDGDFGAQARKDFLFGPELQYDIALQAGLYNQHKVTGRFDADFHYIINPESGFQCYPLAGIDWAVHSKYNRIGANLGAGATLDLNDETRLFIEAKYVVGDWDGFAFTAGIYF